MGGPGFFVRTAAFPMMLFIIIAVYAEVVAAQSTNDTADDCTVQNSIKEMMIKLESVVTSKEVCLNKEGTEPPKPCIDLTSTQSVLTQLCERLTHLDSRVSRVDSRINLLSGSNHNSQSDDLTKPFTQIEKLKEEIKHLKQSAVFYASRRDNLNNFNQERIVNYDVAVNSGVYFNAPNGAFYAPFDGVYHFSLSYQKTSEVDLEASLIVDNIVIASTNDEPRHKINLLTPLKQGQEVWTNSTLNSTPIDTEVTFVFSGYLIQ
jgi:hypothetical protein